MCTQEAKGPCCVGKLSAVLAFSHICLMVQRVVLQTSELFISDWQAACTSSHSTLNTVTHIDTHADASSLSAALPALAVLPLDHDCVHYHRSERHNLGLSLSHSTPVHW
jgi:hypothetical protein